MKITLLLLSSLMVNCATTRDSMLLGGAVGAASAGVVAGHMSEHNPRQTAMGAAIGAATGSLFGYLAHRANERKERERREKLDALRGQAEVPDLSSPEVRTIWVPAHIEDDTYHSGHFIYKIDRNSTWLKKE